MAPSEALDQLLGDSGLFGDINNEGLVSITGEAVTDKTSGDQNVKTNTTKKVISGVPYFSTLANAVYRCDCSHSGKWAQP